MLVSAGFLLLIHLSQGEVYSSVSDMTRVFQLERDLVSVIHTFKQKTEQKLERIKKYLNEFSAVTKELSDKTSIDERIEALAGNPVHTYNVVKRLSIDFLNIEKELRDDVWLETSREVERLRLDGVIPKEKDLHGAAQALIRLQEIYELDISKLASGSIGSRQTTAKLNAKDCLFIGKHCFNAGILSRSLEWFEEAWHLAGEEENTGITQDQVKHFLDHAAKEHDDRVMRGEKGENLFPEPVYKEAPQEQRGKLYFSRKSKVVRNDTDMAKFDGQDDSFNFGALCRGDELRKESVVKNLKCSYSNRNQPFLYLQPVKMEVVHDSPEILVFHEVVFPQELEEIKRLGKPFLTRSQVMGGHRGGNEVSSTRTSKTGWLDDAQHQIVQKLGKRISIVTGLNTDTTQDDAELLQVANYMNGGHYSPHFDYVMKDKDPDYMIHSPNNLFIGDRIATWMFYLSKVGEGGRTVFPRLGAGIQPRMGSAVFWYNLLPDGSPDRLTLHGACPVLYGTKWVANKWIREGSQIFKKPCELTPNAKIRTNN